MNKLFSAIGIMALLVTGGCATTFSVDDGNIDGPHSVGEITFLDQEWDADQRDEFYNTQEGNLIIPYDWFLNLETADSTGNPPDYFREKENIENTGYIMAADSIRNEDGLRPVGFTREEYERDWLGVVDEKVWLGMTCAACHTNQIKFKDKQNRDYKIRIDGAPTLANFFGFLEKLNSSLENTIENRKKFDRFAEKVGANTVDKKTNLIKKMERVLKIRQGWTKRNNPPEEERKALKDGYGRLAAFGAIFNEAQFMASGLDPADHEKIFTKERNANRQSNGPVSYPFLWGARKHDWVQWPGSVPGGVPLVRNFTQAVGVFGHVETTETGLSGAYKSSVRLANLRQLANMIKNLRSPKWPDILGTIDKSEGSKWEKGKNLFEKFCRKCHETVARDLPQESKVKVHLTKLDKEPKYKIKENGKKCISKKEEKADREANKHDGLKTDPVMVKNRQDRKVDFGQLEGRGLNRILAVRKPEKPDREEASSLVTHLFARSLQDDLFETIRFIGEFIKARLFGEIDSCKKDRYKGRGLEGIWATAPYLHNGSVPNLKELMKRKDKRKKKFMVGSRVFDADNVGFKYEKKDYKEGFGTEVDTTKPGNSNAGHEYPTRAQRPHGLTDDEIDALVIYQKSL